MIATQAEAERLAQEKADAEAKEKEEADRIAAEKAEAERLLKEQAEAEAKKSDEADRLAAAAAKASDDADKAQKEAEEKAEEAEEAVEQEGDGEGVLPTARNIGLGAVEQSDAVHKSNCRSAFSTSSTPDSLFDLRTGSAACSAPYNIARGRRNRRPRRPTRAPRRIPLPTPARRRRKSWPGRRRRCRLRFGIRRGRPARERTLWRRANSLWRSV